MSRTIVRQHSNQSGTGESEVSVVTSGPKDSDSPAKPLQNDMPSFIPEEGPATPPPEPQEKVLLKEAVVLVPAKPDSGALSSPRLKPTPELPEIDAVLKKDTPPLVETTPQVKTPVIRKRIVYKNNHFPPLPKGFRFWE